MKLKILCSFLILQFTVSAQVNLTSGLQLYLPFNGNAIDASGNGNNATINGPVLTTDQYGNANSAYQFDGINDFMEIANSASLSLDSGLSLVAKVYPMGFYNSTCQGNVIFQKGNTDYLSGWYTLRYSDQPYDNNCTSFSPTYENFNMHVQVLGAFPFGTTAGLAGAPPYIQQNNWYCVVATWDYDSIRVYINGALTYKYSNQISLGANNDNLFIGKMNNPTYPYWLNGKLDELRIYNRAINYQEVQALCDLCLNSSTDSNVILNNDTAVCNATPIQINTTLVPSDSFIWSPIIGLSNPNSTNPTASPNTTTTYHIDKRIIGCNQIINGSFEGGPYGFTSSYTYTAPTSGSNTTAAQYTVSNNPNPWNLFSSSCTDHTSGTGNMLIVNGSTTANVSIWEQTIAITPNTDYNFSAWVSQWTTLNPSILQFSINGVPLGAPYTAPNVVCTWFPFAQTWNSGSNTTATISILNQSIAFNGNDFSIDDIFFGTIDTLYDSVTITILPAPTVNAGNNISVCQGTNTQLNGAVIGGTAYNWLPSIGLSNATILNPIATISATTTYSLIATNAIGCSDTDEVLITENPLPIMSAGVDKKYCANTNGIQLNGSGIGTASWANAANLSSATVLNPLANPSAITNYTLTITNANNCSNTDVVQVIPVLPPNVIASPNISICLGDTVIITASGGTTYTWLPNAFGIPNNAINKVFPNSNTIYYVTGIDTNFCADTASVTVVIAATPIANAGANIGICQGTTIAQLNGTAIGSTSIIWIPNIGLSNPNILNPTAIITANITYSLVAINAIGCKDTDDVYVNINALPIVNAGVDKIYCSNTNGVMLNGSGAGAPSWAFTNALSNSSILNPIANPNVTTNYTLTVTNSNNCTASDVVQVTPVIAPIVTVSPNVSICLGDSTTLIAAGANNYTWLPSAFSIINNNTNIVYPNNNNTYFVIGSNGTVCMDTANVTVSIYPSINFNITGDSVLCIGDTVALLAAGNVSEFVWNPATEIITQLGGGVTVSPISSTIFTVVATDVNNCKASNTIGVFVDQIPLLSITKSNDIQCTQNTTQLTATGGVTYTWLPTINLNNANIANPIATPFTTTTYTVLAQSIACVNTDTIQVIVFNNNAEKTVIPNAFSPNADGLNDCFAPQSKANFLSYQMRVYNRWGQMVYSTNDPLDCWDGQQNNGQIEMGTYFYIIKAKTDCSEIERKGDVLLIK
jgi:gliding motility-associated-like protein